MSRRPRIPERWRKAASRGVSFLETVRGGASYNPLSPTVIQNPYKTYARLRRNSPVHRSRILGSWVLTRYEDVLTAARDHERFSNDPRWRRATASVLPPAPDDYSILLVDPPEHTRLRKVVAEVFSRTRLRALNEIIEDTACRLIERAVKRRTIDWINDVAAPASMRVMLSMMAIPESDHGQWEIWTRDRARLLEMIATRQQRKTAHLAGAEIQRYFTTLLHDRMRDAINEMLRFDSPVQTDFRIARTEIALRGRKITTGDGVILLTGSANRDERAFENADTFDITRKGPRHLSFGQGVHHCIGAELARLEASAIFNVALGKLGTMELVGGEPRYRTSTVIRGLSALPLSVKGYN